MALRHRTPTGPVPCGAGRGELIDVDGAWWQGFYQGWRDRDADQDPACHDEMSTWAAGYRAGWAAACSEVRCAARRWPVKPRAGG